MKLLTLIDKKRKLLNSQFQMRIAAAANPSLRLTGEYWKKYSAIDKEIMEIEKQIVEEENK